MPTVVLHFTAVCKNDGTATIFLIQRANLLKMRNSHFTTTKYSSIINIKYKLENYNIFWNDIAFVLQNRVQLEVENRSV